MRLIISLFLLLFIIIIFNFYFIKERFKCFKEEKKFDINKPLPIALQRHPNIFNNNYNAKFLPEIKEYNNDNVNDLAYGKKNIVLSLLNNKLSSDFIIFIIDKYNNTNFIISNNKFDNSLKKFKLLTKVSDDIISKLNIKTDYNKTDFNPNKDLNLKYKISDIDDINIINHYFINSFNKIYFNNFKVLYNKYEFKKNNFIIFKYKIYNMYKSNNVLFFELILELNKVNGLFITEIFLTSYILDGKVVLKPIVLIGFKTLDNVFLKHNDTNSNSNYNILKSINNDGFIKHKDIPKILSKREFEINKHINIKKNYNCFNNNLNDKNILKSFSKQDCESNFDVYGINKNYGIWDRPCKSDDECVFYKSNKNYSNNFGKCLNSGYCEAPLNVNNISYHIFNNDKALCYNCDTKDWQSFTELNNCCEKQKDKKLYPHLDGPDYAFKNDNEKRINFKRYNSIYIKYKNIFGKHIDDYSIYQK